jgi:uncharacterized protein (UPF0179 family)
MYTRKITDETVVEILPPDEDCEKCEMKEICERMERNPAYKNVLDGLEVGGMYKVADLKAKYVDGLNRISLDTRLFKMKPISPQ